MAITTGTDHQHSPHPKDHHHQQHQQEHEPDRKLLTKAAHQIFRQRPSRDGRGVPGRVICILLIFAIKIVATAGNAIRNIDHHQIIINDTSSDTSRTSHPLIGDLSVPRPQNQQLHQQMGQQEQHLPLGQLNQDERFATDASRESGLTSSWGRAASYSYFYIGRKLIYVPLFFLLYWTIYNMFLLVQSIAHRWVSAGEEVINKYFVYSHRFRKLDGDLSLSRKYNFIGTLSNFHPTQAHTPQHWPAPTYVDKVRRKKRETGLPEESGSNFERRGRMDDRKEEDSSKVYMNGNVEQVLSILGAIYNFKYKNG